MAIAKSLIEREGTLALTPDGQRYLREKLAERGKTVTALAVELGVSRKHLSNILNGRVPLLEPLLGRLCRALLAAESIVHVLRDRGIREAPDCYGCMRGSMIVLGDLTEPTTDWEMLEG